MGKLTLYLAGGLFSAGEQLHNLFLERALKELGYKVILPQREASDLSDTTVIARTCRGQCTHRDVLYVGNSDGPDADSGTAVEYGLAIATNGVALVYRTDFRTHLETESGVTAMMRLDGSVFVYEPAHLTDLAEVEGYYKKLAAAIDEQIGVMLLNPFVDH